MGYTGDGLLRPNPPKDSDKLLDNTELMFEDYWWVEAINKSYDKDFGVHYLTWLCSKQNRIKIMKDIVCGNFDFGIPKIAKIPKDTGGFREVYVLEKDKRFIGNILSQIYNWKYSDLISENCESYQKGKSTSRTVRELKCLGKPSLKVDISKYFDNVSIETLNKALDKIDSTSPVDFAVRKFYNTNLVEIDGNLEERYKGICQGSPLSGFLSNIILRDVDDKIGALCEEYHRYSDDILALGCDANEVLNVLGLELGKLGLSLNPNKVEVLEPNKEYTFLGYGIKGKEILLSKKSFEKKKKEIKSICKKGKSLKWRIYTINKLLYSGKDEFTNWTYPKFKTITDLERLKELDNYIKDCLRWSITGKWNYVHNKNKVPDEVLKENGYTSLIHMYNISKINKSMWKESVNLVLKGFQVD